MSLKKIPFLFGLIEHIKEVKMLKVRYAIIR